MGESKRGWTDGTRLRDRGGVENMFDAGYVDTVVPVRDSLGISWLNCGSSPDLSTYESARMSLLALVTIFT